MSHTSPVKPSPEQVVQSTQSTQVERSPSLLPRSAWKSQVTYLKTVLKVKQILDRSEHLSEM
jgi:hypothetical protein